MTFLMVGENPTARKLGTFANLPVGWRYGQGGPIAADVIAKAKVLLRYMTLVGFTHTDTFAGADGEVLLTAYHDNRHYLSLTLDPGLRVSITHEISGNECCTYDDKTVDETKTLLQTIAGEIWPTFVWSTHPNTTQFWGNLPTSHSRNLLAAECRSSSGLAPKQPAAA